MVVDDATVFFTNAGAGIEAGLMRMPKGGGTPVAIARSAIGGALSVAIDGEGLFAALQDGRIVRVNKDGTGVLELAKGLVEPSSVVVDTRGVFWVDRVAGQVWTADRLTGKARVVAANQQKVQHVAVDRDRIYWTTDGSVMRVAK